MQLPKKVNRHETTIAGVQVQCPEPFVEGHPLTAHEAKVLNQTFRENMSNNLRKKFSELNGADPQETLDQYIKSYEFGIRTGGGGGPRVVDPVERAALSIAQSKVKEALKRAGYNLKEVGAPKVKELALEHLAKPEVGDQIRAIAQSRIDAESAISIEI